MIAEENNCGERRRKEKKKDEFVLFMCVNCARHLQLLLLLLENLMYRERVGVIKDGGRGTYVVFFLSGAIMQIFKRF